MALAVTALHNNFMICAHAVRALARLERLCVDHGIVGDTIPRGCTKEEFQSVIARSHDLARVVRQVGFNAHASDIENFSEYTPATDIKQWVKAHGYEFALWATLESTTWGMMLTQMHSHTRAVEVFCEKLESIYTPNIEDTIVDHGASVEDKAASLEYGGLSIQQSDSVVAAAPDVQQDNEVENQDNELDDLFSDIDGLADAGADDKVDAKPAVETDDATEAEVGTEVDTGVENSEVAEAGAVNPSLMLPGDTIIMTLYYHGVFGEALEHPYSIAVEPVGDAGLSFIVTVAVEGYHRKFSALFTWEEWVKFLSGMPYAVNTVNIVNGSIETQSFTVGGE